MTVARIGRRTEGQVESIRIQHDDEAARILKRDFTTEHRVANLMLLGDLQRFVQSKDHAYAAHDPLGEPRIVHADNKWPDTGQKCLYLFTDGIWWVRRARTDGGWPDTWEPL